jgi:streptogramin lyase
MSINRREFIGTTPALMAGLALRKQDAQQKPEPAPPPTRQANVERLFKAPDVHPNALEAAPDGLWIGDQVSERVFKVDWETGKVLQELQTESHNTSGLALGGGYMWLNANGGVSGRRPPRPTDKPFGEILQADLKTGKTIKAYNLPWRGSQGNAGIHGGVYVQETQTLWVAALYINALAEMDPKDNLRIVRLIAIKGDRAHGLDWDNGAIWCLFAGDRLVHKLDANTGRILEIITLSPTTDPDPHGMCIHNGYMYYCDAGLTALGPGSAPGMICRFRLGTT